MDDNPYKSPAANHASVAADKSGRSLPAEFLDAVVSVAVVAAIVSVALAVWVFAWHFF